MLACMKRGVALMTEPVAATTGAAVTPMPLSVAATESAAVSADPATLTLSVPVAAPKLVAVNCTLIWQLAPAASVKPQVLLCVKPAVVVICSGDTATVFAFCRMNGRVLLCAPKVTAPKSQLLKLKASGVSAALVGAIPVPDTLTESVPALEFTVSVLRTVPTTTGLNTTV